MIFSKNRNCLDSNSCIYSTRRIQHYCLRCCEHGLIVLDPVITVFCDTHACAYSLGLIAVYGEEFFTDLLSHACLGDSDSPDELASTHAIYANRCLVLKAVTSPGLPLAVSEDYLITASIVRPATTVAHPMWQRKLCSTAGLVRDDEFHLRRTTGSACPWA